MEDAAQAIVMAFSVFIFVIALGLAMANFNLSKEVSDMIINYNDRTYVEEYKEIEEGELDFTGNGRIVGAETVIPTLYRYYKEKFSVDINNSNNVAIELFDLATERRYYRKEIKDTDTYRGATYQNLYKRGYGVIWISSATNIDVKRRVDSYISHSKISYNGDEDYYYDRFNEFDITDTYYQKFNETDQGKKIAIPGTDDGTYFIEKSGTKKMFIHLIKR